MNPAERLAGTRQARHAWRGPASPMSIRQPAPKLWGGWRLRLVALVIGLSLPLWKAYRAYGGEPSSFTSPRQHDRLRLWNIADFGVFHYDFPGQLPNGEAVVLHIWLKALRSENSVLLRAVGAHFLAVCPHPQGLTLQLCCTFRYHQSYERVPTLTAPQLPRLSIC